MNIKLCNEELRNVLNFLTYKIYVVFLNYEYEQTMSFIRI